LAHIKHDRNSSGRCGLRVLIRRRLGLLRLTKLLKRKGNSGFWPAT
jgi:hypothetical protein